MTQFPILPTHEFHYKFKADKVGTHWYHSHTGGQYTDGLLGLLIVRDHCDPYSNLSEFNMILSEWYHDDVIDTFDVFSHYKNKTHNPFVPLVSGLVNGKGRFNCTPELLNKSLCIVNNSLERFRVKSNMIYRFRIVSAASQFTYSLSIDRHNLTIVAMDGIYVDEYMVQEIYIDIGQRYDILVHMNQPVDLYWIRINAANNRQENSSQFYAILQYEGANDGDPESVYTNPLFILDDSTPLKPNNWCFQQTHVIYMTYIGI